MANTQPIRLVSTRSKNLAAPVSTDLSSKSGPYSQPWNTSGTSKQITNVCNMLKDIEGKNPEFLSVVERSVRAYWTRHYDD